MLFYPCDPCNLPPSEHVSTSEPKILWNYSRGCFFKGLNIQKIISLVKKFKFNCFFTNKSLIKNYRKSLERHKLQYQNPPLLCLPTSHCSTRRVATNSYSILIWKFFIFCKSKMWLFMSPSGPNNTFRFHCVPKTTLALYFFKNPT